MKDFMKLYLLILWILICILGLLALTFGPLIISIVLSVQLKHCWYLLLLLSYIVILPLDVAVYIGIKCDMF